LKKLLFLIIIAFPVTLVAQIDSSGKVTDAPDFEKMESEPVGQKLILFQTSDADSSQINDLFQNKVVFLNFWFASCIPCVSEVKGLNDLYDSLKGNPSFQFLSITYESPQVISAFKKKHNIHYQILSLPKEKIKEIDYYEKYPTSIIIRPDRTIIYFHLGAIVNDDGSSQDENKAFIFENYYPVLLKELALLRPI